MSEKILNQDRTSQLWATIKARSPETKILTLAEYNALTQEQRTANVIYLITDDNGPISVTLQSIAITTPPDKTSYTQGETFDPTGMVVTATYSNGTSSPVTDYTFSPNGALEENADKVTISYTYDDVTVTAEQPITVIVPAHIYGVSWNGTSTTKWTRTDESASFADPVPYVAGAANYSSPFDNLMPWSGMVKEERTGGTMVAIPKFWYKLEKNGSGLKLQIADKAVEGFSASPAHMDRGDGKGERDMVYVGRYHCATGYKSTTGIRPKASFSRVGGRTAIHKLGPTIWQSDFVMRFTIGLLYLVEFADWNSQACIGYGCATGEGGGKQGGTDSMPYHTGTMQNAKTTYGVGVQYRNIEGLWDNAFDWIDGCYIASNGFNIILNPQNFNDNDSGDGGGISVGKATSGFPSAFNVTNAAGFSMFIPSAKNGKNNTYMCDIWGYYTGYSGMYMGGGAWRNSLDYGLFYIGCANPSEGIDDVSSRIMELP